MRSTTVLQQLPSYFRWYFTLQFYPEVWREKFSKCQVWWLKQKNFRPDETEILSKWVNLYFDGGWSESKFPKWSHISAWMVSHQIYLDSFAASTLRALSLSLSLFLSFSLSLPFSALFLPCSFSFSFSKYLPLAFFVSVALAYSLSPSLSIFPSCLILLSLFLSQLPSTSSLSLSFPLPLSSFLIFTLSFNFSSICQSQMGKIS